MKVQQLRDLLMDLPDDMDVTITLLSGVKLLDKEIASYKINDGLRLTYMTTHSDIGDKILKGYKHVRPQDCNERK